MVKESVRKNMEEQDGTSSSINEQLIEKNNDGCNKGGLDRKEIVEEVKKQVWLAGPLIGVTLLQFCLQLISVMFVGHLGELALSGASMATSFASVTGFSLLVSFFNSFNNFIIFLSFLG